MTTPLFLLRCVEAGISIADLDLLTIGLVIDIWTEKGNDSEKYDYVANQSRKKLTINQQSAVEVPEIGYDV